MLLHRFLVRPFFDVEQLLAHDFQLSPRIAQPTRSAAQSAVDQQ